MLSPSSIVSFDMCASELGDKESEKIVRAKGLHLRTGGGQSTSSEKLRKHSSEDLIRFLTF